MLPRPAVRPLGDIFVRVDLHLQLIIRRRLGLASELLRPDVYIRRHETNAATAADRWSLCVSVMRAATCL